MKFTKFFLFAVLLAHSFPSVVNAQQEFSVSIGFSNRPYSEGDPLVSRNPAHRQALARAAVEIGCFGTFSAAVASSRQAIRNSLEVSAANLSAITDRVKANIRESFPRVRFTELQSIQISHMAREELAAVRAVNMEFVLDRDPPQNRMAGFLVGVNGGRGRVYNQVHNSTCSPPSEALVQTAHDSIAKYILDTPGFMSGGSIRQFAQAESDRLKGIDQANVLRIFEENEVPRAQAPGR